ncbi:MAG: TylF/MycF/NovP-related O-methyltransferase [Gaiellaceae bacterium]
MASELTHQPVDPDTVAAILKWVEGYTMVPDVGVIFSIEQAIAAVERAPGSVIVECGVWRGGCATAMLLAQRAAFGRVVAPVWMLDSFEGLPPAADRDGPLAQAWQANTDAPGFFDNCAASLADVQAGLDRFGFEDGDVRLVQGWFSATAPAVGEELLDRGISLLRLDGDWHESTMTCLTHLEPHLVDEGVLLVDDYYAWDGCARAVHEYLAAHDLAYRVRSLPSFAGAYLEKRSARTDPDRA